MAKKKLNKRPTVAENQKRLRILVVAICPVLGPPTGFWEGPQMTFYGVWVCFVVILDAFMGVFDKKKSFLSRK